jgi:HEAT repeat protein
MDKNQIKDDKEQKREVFEQELKKMILEYMDKGFLENIIDMFKHDESLFSLIIDMIKDERVRVRLGATALVEELTRSKLEPLIRMIPEIAALLKDENPTIRGDGAYLLEIIGSKEALPYLISAIDDEDPSVREGIKEAIKRIEEIS